MTHGPWRDAVRAEQILRIDGTTDERIKALTDASI